MTCLTCAHSALRDPKDPKRDRNLREMAKQGYAACSLSDYRATFHPFDWSCNRYTEAGEEVVRARVEWRSKA